MKNATKIAIIAAAFIVVIGLVVTGAALLNRSSGNYDDVVVSAGSQENGPAADVSSQPEDQAPYDLVTFANRAYELKYLFAVDSFKSAKNISVNKLVQYAFCHLYYDNLAQMPKKGIKMRETSASRINKVLEEHFGITGVDVTKSDLYNASGKKFEMWQPNYGTDVNYTTNTKQNGDVYETTVTFYNDASQTTVKGTAVITVKKSGENYVIQSMK